LLNMNSAHVGLLGISTMKELVSNSVATRRMTQVLLGLFSGLALVLGAIGIYGARRMAEAGPLKQVVGEPFQQRIWTNLQQGSRSPKLCSL
jgi:hypothetical protein